MHDVLIVGCGVIGAATAYELSKYNLEIAVLEKDNDVANGATKANNAILHAGYDSRPGSLEAGLTLEGIRLAKDLCERLDVEWRRLPAMVVAFNTPQMGKIAQLIDQGKRNGVPGVRAVSREEILEREPNVNPAVVGGLVAPEAAIVNPWEYCIALAETAVRNGVEAHLSAEVLSIDKRGGRFHVATTAGDFEARYVVNAAGNFADRVHAMVGGSGFRQIHNAGEYFLFDKSQGALVNSLVFSCSVEAGFKGTTILPTVHGNLLAGPDFYQTAEPDAVETAAARMESLKQAIRDVVPGIDFREAIREFCGIRPNADIDDFIIEESPHCPGFVNLAGMKSPALSAAPAIAAMAAKVLSGIGLELRTKPTFLDTRRRVKFRELDDEGKRAAIRDNPLHGRVVCRCETVTEAEILDALRRPIVPTTVEAVKRRCNAGMGRCQGGFCGPRVLEILARELKRPPTDILMDREGSYILTGPTKEAGA